MSVFMAHRELKEKKAFVSAHQPDDTSLSGRVEDFAPYKPVRTIHPATPL
jgi:hypothetical protein